MVVKEFVTLRDNAIMRLNLELIRRRQLDRKSKKRDRTARLLKLQVLLWQNPSGLEIQEIARRCATSKRTAYRDLEALETELVVPIWQEGRKRGIAEGCFLPPVTFTQAEAVSVFL